MARRKSLTTALIQAARDAERAKQQRLRAHSAAIREAERARAAYQRASAAQDRERRRLYAESRAAETAARNADLADQVTALETLLVSTLDVDDHIEFSSLKKAPQLPQWRHAHLQIPLPPPQIQAFLPPPLSGLAKITKKASYDRAVAEAHMAYEAACRQYADAERRRVGELTEARASYERSVTAARAVVAAQHSEIDAFEAEFKSGDPDAIVSYFTLVLESSAYPEGFERQFRVAFVPDSRQLVVEYELPTIDVVPATRAYRYVKGTDEVTATARPPTQIRSIYRSTIAQVTLRTIHELFEADRSRQVDVIVFNGVVDSIDRATGQSVRPCLISLRTTRDTFSTLDLANVEPQACLRHLSAGVSKNPEELAPVRPVLEFDMVDSRFIEESDALSTLDQRQNLMELSPIEFESLIQNLFTKMGLEAKQTKASRDGGVDCVAYDPRPIFGGKVVIQAKRYKNTVGVSAVRDLFGTLQNEGASKGILVTTSGYGPASFEFAHNKPIELIDGANLLYLLAEYTGIEARIIPPTDWRDPTPD